jgi:hypothetical protein
MDLVIKIGFGLVSTLVMVNLIFCTPLIAYMKTFVFSLSPHIDREWVLGNLKFDV